MSRAALRHEVVVCTRNRPEELQRCLEALAHQERPADLVRVVDASDPDQAEEVAQVVASLVADGVPVDLASAPPSTSAQRNVAVAASTADVIHFLDDDTEVEPGYLAAILARFEADPRPLDDPAAILGVGGLPTDLPAPPTGVHRRLHPRAATPGAVLASGRGVLASGLTDVTDVEWLSGCAMSFRRRAIAAEPFDEGPTGYVLGEDLDASYRIRQHGRLLVEPAARLVHRESPRNRWARRRWAEVDVVHRRRRVNSGTGRYRVAAFWADGLAQLVLWSARSLRPGSTSDRATARATAVGLAAGLVAAARVRDAAPAPGPWPPSAEAVGEAPAG